MIIEILTLGISAAAIMLSILSYFQSRRVYTLERKYKALNEQDLVSKRAPRIQISDQRIKFDKKTFRDDAKNTKHDLNIGYSSVVQNKATEVAKIESVTIEAKPVGKDGKELDYGLGALVTGSVYLAPGESISPEAKVNDGYLNFVRAFFDLEDSTLILRVCFKYSGYTGDVMTQKIGLLAITKANSIRSYSNWKPPLKESRGYPLAEHEPRHDEVPKGAPGL